MSNHNAFALEVIGSVEEFAEKCLKTIREHAEIEPKEGGISTAAEVQMAGTRVNVGSFCMLVEAGMKILLDAGVPPQVVMMAVLRGAKTFGLADEIKFIKDKDGRETQHDND